jgi:molybdopterin/thiamine biosynthesis adenylyltransferase
MSEELNVEHSRATRLAARASDSTESALEQRLSSTDIQLSLEPQLPGAGAVARVLISTLRRQPGEIYLDTAGIEEEFVREIEAICRAIDPAHPLRRGRVANPSASLHVGIDERAALRIVPDNHGARLARGGELAQRRAPSGLAIVYAAALAAAEIFKDVARVMPSRQVRHELLEFCPVALSDDLEAAPPLNETQLDLALVGIGAVGSATSLILSLLPISGRVLLVDPEVFEAENRGTYSLGDDRDARKRVAKVELAARQLARFDPHRFVGRVEEAVRAIDDGELPWPKLVLSGLDSVEARYSTQLLWPDLIVDSATGDTACGVHVCRDGDACLMCLFPAREDLPSAVTQLVEATGLTREQLADGQRSLEESDLEALPEEKKQLLKPHVGAPVCGLARAIGLVPEGDADYLPSIPFVSQQAACLGIGRLVAHLAGLTDTFTEQRVNLIQYDTLLGPAALTPLRQQPRPECYSVNRRPTIEAVRNARSLRASSWR